MAGHFEKLNGNVYEGGYVASEDLTNGLFVVLTNNTVGKNGAADKTLRMRVAEKTELYGLPAVRLVVTDAGADEVYFVEGEWDIDDNGEYDESLYTISSGDYVRMRRPQTGDRLIMSVSAGLYAALAVDNIVEPVATGIIAVA